MIHEFLTKTVKNSKRVGRGYGSGKGGHTSGRGSKGAKSRTGYKRPRKGFEGGQMPLSRRLPKLRGFSRAFFQNKNKVLVINVEMLNVFPDGTTVNMETLNKQGFLKKSKDKSVKILGNGELTKKLTIEKLVVSAKAVEKIVKLGGKVL
jgi:large subunit ribosomal protein L15